MSKYIKPWRPLLFCSAQSSTFTAPYECSSKASLWSSWQDADRLPVVVRLPAGPQVSLKCDDQSKDNGAGHKKKSIWMQLNRGNWHACLKDSRVTMRHRISSFFGGPRLPTDEHAKKYWKTPVPYCSKQNSVVADVALRLVLTLR